MQIVTYTSRLREADISALILRLALGAAFILHGGQKHFGWFGGPGWDGSIKMISQMAQVPHWMAMLAIIAEFYGGISVLLGLFTRLGALGIAINMMFAIMKVHRPHGYFAQNMGYEYPLALLAIALALVIFGAGRWSLDSMFAKDRDDAPRVPRDVPAA